MRVVQAEIKYLDAV